MFIAVTCNISTALTETEAELSAQVTCSDEMQGLLRPTVASL